MRGSSLDAPAATLLASTRRLSALDELRVPYAVRPPANGRAEGLHSVSGAAGALHWPSEVASPAELYRLDGSLPLYARVLSDDAAARRLGPGWEPETAITDEVGEPVAHVWRRGSEIFLPFDPDAAAHALRSEAYVRSSSGAARRAYYRVRPLLPRAAQIGLRRAFSRIQARTPFPRWPLETALHDLSSLVLRLVAEAAGEPVPTIAPWPAGRTWALVLTHDVETDVGYRNLGPVRAVEEEHGYRSSWNFVPERYSVEDEVVDELWAAGHEVGVHGLRHDGRDLESLPILQERLPEIRRWAERWRAVGFRSPATHRNWDWMPLLGFDYDTSSPDTDPFEPQAGGCCSWLPFFNEDLVELPITVPQDHAAFVILRRGESLWTDKIDALRKRGGMALMITHPDYMVDGKVTEAYRRTLARYGEDKGLWRALPLEVASWWRRRALSHLERSGDGWAVRGPAADGAAIRLEEAAC
jgi:peptidoglycan/xylan/chitin deacetylase (PgdA/CDA1 family)